MVLGPKIVSLNQAKTQWTPQLYVDSTAYNWTDRVVCAQVVRSQAVQSDQGVPEQIYSFASPSEARTDRDRGQGKTFTSRTIDSVYALE